MLRMARTAAAVAPAAEALALAGRRAPVEPADRGVARRVGGGALA
jgi:hypothetical protein